MKTKTPIKIIKRGERNRPEPQVAEPTKKTTQETARDMVATVSEWVNEFQQKRRMETTQALKTLFADTTPQASKA
jgi:hypothetical protein